jgi:hypothetical protein
MLNVVFAAGSIAATTGLLATTEYLPIDHVYTIKGFDNNDNSEVMIEGYLPDLCYQTPIAKARVIGKKVIVDVTGTRDSNPDRICAQMTVPFLTTVHVGVLDTGAYDVIVNGASGSATRATLNIVESSSSAIDNYIYANVEYVEKDGYDGKIQLKGYNPSDCLELDRVEFVSNELDSYAVLPIMKKVRESCPMKMMPFSYETEVPNDLSRDKVLLHVRVMNGKSVNTIYSAM